jgi:nucleotide sugar dehydrogenase
MTVMKVCVVGLGQIGLPVAEYTHLKGLETWGYDISAKTVETISASGKIKVTDSWEEIPQVDVYLICVTTGQTNECPDLSAVFEVCQKIAHKTRSSPKTDSLPLVSIESTVVPGTSKKVFDSIFEGKVKLVHAPHRYWADEPEKYGVNQPRVIGAANKESLNAGAKFYRETLGISMYECATIEVAEMCKITENSHRYLQIAFAEELKMMCAKVGFDFEDLRKACNTKWNVNIPEAREGIGRHCLPKDVRYVISLVPSQILESAINVDKQYRTWLSKQK